LNGTNTISTRAVAVPLTRAQVVALTLTAIVMVAVTFRTFALATYGLSDDEVTKVRAAEAYSRGDFGVNAEHPMLMKAAIWGSLGAADTWNQIAPARYRVPVETAVRLPNAVIGAGTVLVMYGVARAFFGTPVALVAALLLALDPNITSINRLAKEDTFVVFFFLLAVWLYERAKQVGTTDVVRAQRWYLGSAGAFGWMMASKYLPHLYGMYALVNVATLRNAGPNSPIKRRFFATMAVAFVAANFVSLVPSTWQYMIDYAHGVGLPHHGWPYAHRLWVTDVPISPLGIPPTFYLMLLLTRVPLVTLAGAAVGVVVAVYRRRERGYVFLRVMLVLQIIGYSALAAKFLRYSLPILVLFDLLAAVGIVTVVSWLAKQAKSEGRAFLMPIAYGALALVLFAGQVQASPFFSMHRNTLARWLDADGRRFPEGAYDFGVREAAAHIAASAVPGAEILSDVPEVVRFYLARSSRSDIRVMSFSGSTLYKTRTEQWVMVQDAHVYFETDPLIALLRMRHAPVAEYRIGDLSVLQLFRISR
jgi:hypothetical protein